VGFCPRDRALGLQDESLSPGVLRMVGRVGAMVSFEEGHELLTELAAVEVPPSTSSGQPKLSGARSPRTSGRWSNRRPPTSP